MKILFTLGHPAHFHFYKNIIDELMNNDHFIKIVISDKDILRKLLDNHGYEYNILSKPRKNESVIQKILRLAVSCVDLLKIVRSFQPDLLVGCLTQMGLASFLTRTPSIFNGEDDFSYTFLQGLITYPFMNYIVTPFKTNISVFSYKQIGYEGFQKLAYLHPNRFVPDRYKVDLPENEPFFILRFSSQSAYHDLNAVGLNNSIASRLIDILAPHGRVIITSERELPEEFEKYRFKGNLNDMHHYLYFANLYVGDSQSMAVEAAMLGTLGIRFNNFIKKINVLEELESNYQLSIGIHSSQPDLLFKRIKEILGKNDGNVLSARRKKLLLEKIDVSGFLVWFIENYPESCYKIKNNPQYQYNFK